MWISLLISKQILETTQRVIIENSGNTQKRLLKLCCLLDIKRFHRLLDNSVTKGCCGSKIKQVYWFYLEWINSQNTSWLFRHGQAGWALGCHSTFQYEIRTTTCTLERQTKVLPSSDDIHLTTFLATHALSPCDRPCPPTLCNLHVCVFLQGLLTNKTQNHDKAI